MAEKIFFGGIEYTVVIINGKEKELEVDISNQSVDERALRRILKKEFGNFSKRKLYFLVDNSLLVITETDWVEFGKREETKDE